jgi:phosphoserine phosphatase
VLDCERATIFLYDAEHDELYSRVAKGVEDIRFSAKLGIAGTVAQKRLCVNVPDAYADERFNKEVDKQTGFRTHNLLTFPLENLQGELIGVLQALNKANRPFDNDDEELARTLSAQAGVALDRGRLIEEFAEKQRMARDLDIARSIQRSLLPDENPIVPGFEIAGWSQSADETGGDTYDFFPLDDGRLALILADATGHGIGAALVIAQCRSLFRAMLSVTHDLPTIARGVNDLLADDLASDRFVTAFIGILDPTEGLVEYIAAGQGPLIMLGPDGVESRPATSMPFAVVEDLEYDAARFELARGAMLILMTDGFYEAARPEGELFGETRVIDFIRERPGVPLEELISQLHVEIERYVAGAPQADDLTAVVIRRK